jgi:hypothetical protein
MYQNTKAFLQNNFLLADFEKGTFFLGLKKQIKENNESFNN